MDLIDEFKQHINEFVELKEAGKIDNEKLAMLIDVVKQNPALSKTEIAEKVYGSKTRTENVYNLIKKAFELLENENPPTTQNLTKEEQKAMKQSFKTLILEKTGPYRPVLEQLAQQFGEDILSSYYIAQMSIAIAFQSVDLDFDSAMQLLKKMYGNKHEFEEWVVQKLAALLEAKRDAQAILNLHEEIEELKASIYDMYKTVLIHEHARMKAETQFNTLLDAIKTALMLTTDKDTALKVSAFIDMKLKSVENVETPALKELKRLEELEKKYTEEYMKGKEIPIEEAKKK
jgi:2-C-methyl-D-erythritol 4-phosphate cytidylyltransferase